MGGGSQPYDYKAETQYALGQANLPKSPLAQDLSDRLQGFAPQILDQMGNAQQMGAAVLGQYYQPTPQNTPAPVQNTYPKQSDFNPPPQPSGPVWQRPQNYMGTGVTRAPSPQELEFFSQNQGSQAGGMKTFNGGMVNMQTNPANAPAPQQQQQGYNLGLPQVTQATVGQAQNVNQLDPAIMAQMGQQIQAPQTNFGTDPFSGVNAQLAGQFNPQQFAGIPQLQQMIQSAFNGQGNPLAGGLPQMPGQVNAQGVNIDNSQINPQDSQFYQGVQDLFQRNQQKDIADLRARFGVDGTSRGTGAAFAEGNYRAESLGQLGTALGQLRQNEFQNLLAQRGLAQQGNLANFQMLNDAALTGRGQDITGRGQTLDAMLQGGQQQNNNLGALLNSFTTMRGQDISNAQGNLEANLSRLGLLSQNAQNAGQLNLGQNALQSQNALQAAGLNTDRMNALLSQQNTASGNQMDYLLGNRGIDANMSQFNAAQGNEMGRFVADANQRAIENMLTRQFTGQQNLLQGLLGLAQAGIPGGGANVNMSPYTGPTQSGLSQWGDFFQGIGSMIPGG